MSKGPPTLSSGPFAGRSRCARTRLELRDAQLRLGRRLDILTAAEPRNDVLRREWPAVPEALRDVTADLNQPVTRVHRLHALRDDGQPQAMRETDDGTDDRVVVLVVGHVEHEGLVNLDLVHRQLLEVRQRRVTDAEVVDR